MAETLHDRRPRRENKFRRSVLKFERAASSFHPTSETLAACVRLPPGSLSTLTPSVMFLESIDTCTDAVSSIQNCWIVCIGTNFYVFCAGHSKELPRVVVLLNVTCIKKRHRHIHTQCRATQASYVMSPACSTMNQRLVTSRMCPVGTAHSGFMPHSYGTTDAFLRGRRRPSFPNALFARSFGPDG